MISPSYDRIQTNISIYACREKNRKLAEIDILAVKDGRIDIYEVKCSYRKTKAKKQLERLKALFPEVRSLFFFCGESGSLERML